jgi:hypothetical protein
MCAVVLKSLYLSSKNMWLYISAYAAEYREESRDLRSVIVKNASNPQARGKEMINSFESPAEMLGDYD